MFVSVRDVRAHRSRVPRMAQVILVGEEASYMVTVDGNEPDEQLSFIL